MNFFSNIVRETTNFVREIEPVTNNIIREIEPVLKPVLREIDPFQTIRRQERQERERAARAQRAAEAKAREEAERRRLEAERRYEEQRRAEREAAKARLKAEKEARWKEEQRLRAEAARQQREREKAAAREKARQAEIRRAVAREAERLREKENARRAKVAAEAAAKENALQRVPAWLKKYHNKVHIAICGISGSGKTTLVNTVCGVDAFVGHGKEGTTEPESFPLPGFPDVLVWNIAGSGTAEQPDATYLEDWGIRHYDIAILLTIDRIREMDAKLFKERKKHYKPTLIARNKVDTNMDALVNDYEESEADAFSKLRRNFASEAGWEGLQLDIVQPKFFLLSGRKSYRSKYDMPEMEEALRAILSLIVCG